MSLESRNGWKSAQRSLALSLYAGIFLYCALSFFLGPAGLSAYRLLEGRKRAMQANLAELESAHARLASELEALKSDPDRAAVEARSLGYLRKGETALVLGERRARAASIDGGRVLPFARPAALGDEALKRIALGAFLAVLALLLAPRGEAGRGSAGIKRRHRLRDPRSGPRSDYPYR